MEKVSTLNICPFVNTPRSKRRLPRLLWLKGRVCLSETLQIFRAKGKEQVLIGGSRVAYPSRSDSLAFKCQHRLHGRALCLPGATCAVYQLGDLSFGLPFPRRLRGDRIGPDSLLSAHATRAPHAASVPRQIVEFRKISSDWRLSNDLGQKILPLGHCWCVVK